MPSVCIITELFYPSIGGQEIRYFEISKILSHRGYKVDIYTIDNYGNLPEVEYIQPGICVYRIIKDKHYKIKILRRNILTIIRFTFKIFKIIRRKTYQFVIINQWPVLTGILGRYICKRSIAILDLCELRKGILWYVLQLLMIKGTHKIIAINNEIAMKVKKKYDSRKSVMLIPSGVNIDEYIYDNNEREYLLFIGRLEPHKHPDHAIEAVMKYNSNCKEPELLKIVGSGTMLEYLRSKYAHEKTVQFLGFVSEEEKKNILAKAKLLILPSEREGFPRVIAECIASGVPVITTDYPNNGARDIVLQYNIGVVTKPDIEALAEGIKKCLDNYDFYRENCIKYRRELDWNIIMNKLNSIIK